MCVSISLSSLCIHKIVVTSAKPYFSCLRLVGTSLYSEAGLRRRCSMILHESSTHGSKANKSRHSRCCGDRSGRRGDPIAEHVASDHYALSEIYPQRREFQQAMEEAGSKLHQFSLDNHRRPQTSSDDRRRPQTSLSSVVVDGACGPLTEQRAPHDLPF